jgi:hypothetical protein
LISFSFFHGEHEGQMLWIYIYFPQVADASQKKDDKFTMKFCGEHEGVMNATDISHECRSPSAKSNDD